MSDLVTGTFSFGRSGRLQVVFTMRVLVDGVEYAGQADDVFLRAYVGSGPGRLTAILDANSPTAVLNLPYTADTEIPVGIEEASVLFDAADEIGADLLRVTCLLLPAAPATLTFDGLLAYMRAQLQRMSDTPYVPRGSDDIEGDVWWVRPIDELAIIPKDPTPAPYGYLNIEGRATITDPDGQQIWGASCVAWSYKDGAGTDPRPMTCEVLPGGTQVRISGGYTPDELGGLTTGRWSLTYLAAPSGSGTSYEDPWAGFPNVAWGSIAPGDTLQVAGLHDDAQLDIAADGVAGAYVKVRLDYATDPGAIFQSRIVPAAAWEPAPNGEYSLADVTTANNMVFEDRRRMRGPSTTSLCKARVYVVDPLADTLEVAGERPIYTGMPLHVPQDVTPTALPTGLQFAPDRGVPYYAILVSAVAGGRYLIKLADTAAAAAAGVAVDIVDAGAGGNLFLWITDATHADPVPGSLEPGQFGWDPVDRRLYIKPSYGTPADHELRISNDKDGRTGSCIIATGRQYVKIIGGGEYGGIFAAAATDPRPAPVGQVGLAHLNAIFIDGGNDIIVDGIEIYGARSGVVFNGTVRGTHRNSRVRDMGWHATGGETVTSSEPYLLQERLWISEIGQGHDYGDCQALVTNPGSTRATFRRSLVQRCGRDSQYVNNGSSVADSSVDVAVYRNWYDDDVGEEFECGSGPDGDVVRPLFMSNVVTRSNRRTNAAGQPEHARRCVIGLFCGGTDDMIDGTFAGNLIAGGIFETSVVFPAEPVGVLVARSANTAALNSGHQFMRNAIFGCIGNVYAKKTGGTVPNTPSFSANENLFVGLTDFYEQDLSGGPDVDYDAAHVLGSSAGFWSFDTGNDVDSQLGVPQSFDRNAAPTVQQLEFLRQDDAWDSDELPTLEQIGDFPLTA